METNQSSRILLLSSSELRGAPALTRAARAHGWRVVGLDRIPEPELTGTVVYYGGSEDVEQIAARFQLALIEPPLDLLPRIPNDLLLREVTSGRLDRLGEFSTPTFVKPANPRRKVFDAGVYIDIRQARFEDAPQPRTLVLVSEPVDWWEEYRCFILEGEVAACSPYLNMGRAVWRPYSEKDEPFAPPAAVLDVCCRLTSTPGLALPPAFVVDVGLIAGRGWAVVEFNPAWNSGLLGCDPARVLPVLERGCRDARTLSRVDRKWVLSETQPTRPSRSRRFTLGPVPAPAVS
jgi:hypothetical protein